LVRNAPFPHRAPGEVSFSSGDALLGPLRHLQSHQERIVRRCPKPFFPRGSGVDDPKVVPPPNHLCENILPYFQASPSSGLLEGAIPFYTPQPPLPTSGARPLSSFNEGPAVDILLSPPFLDHYKHPLRPGAPQPAGHLLWLTLSGTLSFFAEIEPGRNS